MNLNKKDTVTQYCVHTDHPVTTSGGEKKSGGWWSSKTVEENPLKKLTDDLFVLKETVNPLPFRLTNVERRTGFVETDVEDHKDQIADSCFTIVKSFDDFTIVKILFYNRQKRH